MNLGREQLWRFPGRKVSAFLELVVIDEVVIRLLRPTPRGLIELVGEDAHGSRDGDVDGSEEARLSFVKRFQVETGRGNPRVRQPVECDVVEDFVSRDVPERLSVEEACNFLVTDRVVVENLRCQADGRIR